MTFYGGLPSTAGAVGVSVVSKYSVDGDETGEMRLRIELDEDLVRDIYGLGDLGVVSVVGEVFMRSPVMGTSPKPGITSIPNSSVRGRGGGRSTMASRSFDEQPDLTFFFDFKISKYSLLFVTSLQHIRLPFPQDPITPFPS